MSIFKKKRKLTIKEEQDKIINYGIIINRLELELDSSRRKIKKYEAKYGKID